VLVLRKRYGGTYGKRRFHPSYCGRIASIAPQRPLASFEHGCLFPSSSLPGRSYWTDRYILCISPLLAYLPLIPYLSCPGSATFQTLLSSPSLLSSLTTLTRRPLPSTESSKVSYHNAVLDLTNPSSWPSPWPVPNGGGAAVEGEGKKTFVSCLGTTKAAAGSLKEQEKVDLDMNLNLAKAAKEQGVETVRPSFLLGIPLREYDE
jgi:hypothetical protein